MFGDTWKWAGKLRLTNKNIGTDWTQVAVSLRHLLDDTKAQIEHKAYEPDEMAVRFHHQLVWIHPFPNGNGRHSRLMADLLALRLGSPRLTWGSESLKASSVAPAEIRARYISALRSADAHDYAPLLAFVQS